MIDLYSRSHYHQIFPRAHFDMIDSTISRWGLQSSGFAQHIHAIQPIEHLVPIRTQVGYQINHPAINHLHHPATQPLNCTQIVPTACSFAMFGCFGITCFQ
jgi:hypothetical protein